MSLDIHYQTCNFNSRVMKKNPFTGKMQSVSVADTLSKPEQQGILDLFRKADAPRPAKFGEYVINLPDGGSADIRPFEDNESSAWAGLLVSLHVLTPAMAHLLRELCRVGNMAAIPVFKEQRGIVLVATEEQRAKAIARWSVPITVPTPDDLFQILSQHSIAGKDNSDSLIVSRTPMTRPEQKLASMDGSLKLDLQKEFADIYDFVQRRIASFDRDKNAGPGAPGDVSQIDIGYQCDQDGWVCVVFDTRADPQPDGEWTLYIDGNLFPREHWLAIFDALDEKSVTVATSLGIVRELAAGAHDEFSQLLGEMLKAVLLKGRDQGLFATLPKANACHICVEEFGGTHYGWPPHDERGKIDLT